MKIPQKQCSTLTPKLPVITEELPESKAGRKFTFWKSFFDVSGLLKLISYGTSHRLIACTRSQIPNTSGAVKKRLTFSCNNENCCCCLCGKYAAAPKPAADAVSASSRTLYTSSQSSLLPRSSNSDIRVHKSMQTQKKKKDRSRRSFDQTASHVMVSDKECQVKCTAAIAKLQSEIERLERIIQYGTPSKSTQTAKHKKIQLDITNESLTDLANASSTTSLKKVPSSGRTSYGSVACQAHNEECKGDCIQACESKEVKPRCYSCKKKCCKSGGKKVHTTASATRRVSTTAFPLTIDRQPSRTSTRISCSSTRCVAEKPYVQAIEPFSNTYRRPSNSQLVPQQQSKMSRAPSVSRLSVTSSKRKLRSASFSNSVLPQSTSKDDLDLKNHARQQSRLMQNIADEIVMTRKDVVELKSMLQTCIQLINGGMQRGDASSVCPKASRSSRSLRQSQTELSQRESFAPSASSTPKKTARYYEKNDQIGDRQVNIYN